MRKATLSLLLLATAACGSLEETPARRLRVPLWTGGAPTGDGRTEDVRTELQVYLPPSAISKRPFLRA